MAADVTIFAALLAGLVSFLSPCVLPLVPPYLVYLAGTSLERLADKEPAPQVQRDTVLAAALFVAGFSTIFVALGASASVIGALLRFYSNELAVVAGIAIIIMGLHFLGLTPIGFLYRQARIEVQKPVGLWGAYVMGWPLRSAGRRASGRSWPRSWQLRRRRPPWPRAQACSPSIRSGLVCRSSSRRSPWSRLRPSWSASAPISPTSSG